jgi:membrane protein insertase Oxa1/YidC/SpoIIIJ
MFIWSTAIDLLRVLLFALSHVCGGSLGGAIIVLSLIVRVALLPFTLRLATRARAYQAAIEQLAPKTEALRKRYGNDPLRLAQETQALYAANGVGILPRGVAAAITFVVAWRLSAATALYWVASNAVGVVQSLLLRRRTGRQATA